MVKYHEEFGGGYLATLEIAHYMHCLVRRPTPSPDGYGSPSHYLQNMLRKRTYWEHYGPLDDTYQRDPDFYRVHLGQCSTPLHHAWDPSPDDRVLPQTTALTSCARR